MVFERVTRHLAIWYLGLGAGAIWCKGILPLR